MIEFREKIFVSRFDSTLKGAKKGFLGGFTLGAGIGVSDGAIHKKSREDALANGVFCGLAGGLAGTIGGGIYGATIGYKKDLKEESDNKAALEKKKQDNIRRCTSTSIYRAIDRILNDSTLKQLTSKAEKIGCPAILYRNSNPYKFLDIAIPFLISNNEDCGYLTSISYDLDDNKFYIGELDEPMIDEFNKKNFISCFDINYDVIKDDDRYSPEDCKIIKEYTDYIVNKINRSSF